MTKCPRCNAPTNYTPILVWEGCNRCMFGVWEYRDNLYGSRMNYNENWEKYREAMREAFEVLRLEKEKKEVDKLCEGVL